MPILMYIFSINLVVDRLPMFFMGKWQHLMLPKQANQRIRVLRFHLVGYAGKLYPWSQKFDSSKIRFSLLFIVEILHIAK